MGKLFWIVCGLGFVAALGVWLALTGPMARKVVAKRREVDQFRTALHKWADKGPKGKWKDIRNQSFITVANAYTKDLATEEKALLEQMRARNMSIALAEFSDPPPMGAVSDFRPWLTEEYGKRNAKLRDAGVIVPDDALALGDVPNWDEVVKKDLPRILREFRVSCEAFKALAAAAADVHYKANVLDKGIEKLVENDQKMKSVEFVMLRFEKNDAVPGAGRRRRAAGATQKKSSLVEEHPFSFHFSAHHAVVLDFIRRLEASKVGVFRVQTAQISRTERTESKGEAFANEVGREAPVSVELRLSLLEFAGQAEQKEGK